MVGDEDREVERIYLMHNHHKNDKVKGLSLILVNMVKN